MDKQVLIQHSHVLIPLMDSDCEAPGGVADGGSSFRSHRRSRCQVISIKGLDSGLSSHSGEANRSWVFFEWF